MSFYFHERLEEVSSIVHWRNLFHSNHLLPLQQKQMLRVAMNRSWQDRCKVCVIWILFSLHALLVGFETHGQCEMISKSKSCPSPFASWSSEAHMKIFFKIKGKVLVLIEWSYRSPSLMLTFELRVVSMIIWARCPIFVKHVMFLWCLFLDSHLRTYHSNICVLQIIAMLNSRTSTLEDKCFSNGKSQTTNLCF